MPNLPAVSGHEIPSEISILDDKDPRSVVNLVPPLVRQAIENTPDWYLSMEASELKRVFKAHDGYEPTITDCRLRISFWQEYDSCHRRQKPMIMANVYGGVCSRNYFFEKFIRDKQRMAWLLCPPSDYQQMLGEALLFGIEQMRQILELPHESRDNEGNLKGFDAKLASVKVEIVKMIDQRVKGAVVQRTQNMHMHASTSESTQKKEEIPETLVDIETKIAALEAEIQRRATPHGGAVTLGAIEVEHKDVTVDPQPE